MASQRLLLTVWFLAATTLTGTAAADPLAPLPDFPAACDALQGGCDAAFGEDVVSDPQVWACTKFSTYCDAVYQLYLALAPQGNAQGTLDALAAAAEDHSTAEWVLERATAVAGAAAQQGPALAASAMPGAPAPIAVAAQVQGSTPSGDPDELADLLATTGVTVAAADATAGEVAQALPVTPGTALVQAAALADTLLGYTNLGLFNVGDAPLGIPAAPPAAQVTDPDAAGGPADDFTGAARAGFSEVQALGDGEAPLAAPTAQPSFAPAAPGWFAAAAPLAARDLVAPSIAIAAFAVLVVLLVPPLYHRLQKQKLLDHDSRARLYQLIAGRPGIHIEELAREAAISRSTAVYHLRLLARHGHVVALGARKSVHYYLNNGGVDAGQRAQRALLASPRARAVAACVLAQPGISRNELAPAAGITLSTLSWHLGRLVDAGLMEDRVLEGGQRGLFPAPGLGDMMAPWSVRMAEPEQPATLPPASAVAETASLAP